MKISRRLYAICDAVGNNESVADIGTDHGYVPILLCKGNKSPFVIMSDISASSLQKAVNSFAEEGIEIEQSSFRVGDGLRPIKPGEVDTIVIAGLGGHTIASILNDDIEKTRSFNKLILQPRKHAGSLRYWLYVNGFNIINDILVKEGKFSCDIIVAVPVTTTLRTAEQAENNIVWSYPESFAFCDTNALKNRIDWKISAIDEEIRELNKSSEKHTALIEKLNFDKAYLLELSEKSLNNNEKA